MKKKSFGKLMAIALASSMIMQQGSFPVLAEETAEETLEEQVSAAAGEESAEKEKKAKKKEEPAEKQTEAPTEKQTEKPTEAPTEKQTEAPTEKQTEAPTEKPTEAPTEKQTEAPTEKPTEAPTEKQTEAPTEKQTEAPTEKQTEKLTEKPTEKQTEAPAEKPTEKQTEAPAEKETEKQTEASTEKETEKQTEASTEKETEKHVNDGKKLKLSALRGYLKQALSSLVTAKDYSGPELTEQELLTGEEASAILDGLKTSSLILANARSTSEVEVINLYADKHGKLDTSPLEELFQQEKIDVSEKYAVVNVIAASADQNLDFSGYDLVYKDAPVTYESVTREGYVLYNFATLKKDTFVDYQGTVTLSDEKGLQGTYLAPAGTVKVQSDLEGAVYARSAEVQADAELTRIVFIDGRDEEAETESEEQLTEADTEQESSEEETAASQETEVIEAQESAGQETADQQITAGSSADTEQESSEAESQESEESETVEPETTDQQDDTVFMEEIDLSDMLAGTSAETADQTETDAEPVEDKTQTESETGLLADAMALAADQVLEEGDVQDSGAEWYSETGIIMKAQLADENGHVVSGNGKLVIYAAEDILKDGEVYYAKDQEIGSSTWTAGDTAAHEIGSFIGCSGKYYVEAVEVPEGYLAGSRIYFTADSMGEAVFASDVTAWDAENKLLNYPVYAETEEEVQTSTVITLNGGDKTISGAKFLVKDSTGKLITDKTGMPKYYVKISKGKAILKKLPAGTYYLSQIKAADGYLASEDIKFTVKEGEKGKLDVVNRQIPEISNTISVSMETLYQDTVLTAEKKSESYIALFLDKKYTKKASDVKMLTQKKGENASDTVTFAGLAAGKTYYLAETDEFGIPLGNLEGNKTEFPYQVRFTEAEDTEKKAAVSVTFPANTSKNEKTESETSEVQSEPETGEMQTEQKNSVTEKTLLMQRSYQVYPEKLFSYKAKMKLTLRMYDEKKKAKAVKDTFYVTLFRDEDHSVKLAKPVEMTLNDKSSITLSLSFKMTEGSAVYYALETDASGKVLENGNDNYEFAVGFQDTVTRKTDGSVSVACGKESQLVVSNTLCKSVVKMKVTDPDGKLLPGAELVMKNESGKVLSVNKVVKFNSESKEIEWTGILPNGTYYLSEVKAPDGYHPAPDVSFTVESGKTAEVVLVNQKASSGPGITAGIQAYTGADLLYAQDITSGQYASEGRYTRYAALFSDQARTQKVTNVQRITITGFSGAVKFANLEQGKTYYIAETDQYGQVLGQSKYGGTIQYTDGGKMTLGSSDGQLVIREVYSSLPTGFRYTAKLTLEKRVTDSTGSPKAVTGSFYIGIFRTADYSDTPTVVRLDLNNASSASVTKRVLLSGESGITYYIAEVDQSGTRISDSSDFTYTPSVDNPQLTLTKSAEVKATVTNKEKISKVTLYLTKRVYEGSAQKAVTETFYAGLFKDPEFTQLYTNPIPLKLENSSTVTLKLSLNLGKAAEATIYVAEVDQNGKVVESGEKFGYDVKMLNAAAAFNQERTEIQTVLLNTIHGTASQDDWNQIISNTENDIGGYNSGGGFGFGSGSYGGYYSNVSDNGSYAETTGAVQTGDETPWNLYLTLLVLSGLGILAGAFSRRRRKG